MEVRQAAVFIVATPIGNLDDISVRALATLRNVDIIAAEDTRNTRKLLTHFGILGKELISYHDHGEEERASALVERISKEGLSLAVVSDAGTPCIADPGYRIVRNAKDHGIKVYPVPGPSALTSLISASGLPSNRFMFVGFLPTKSKDLKNEVLSWRPSRASIVFFSPTRRLEECFVSILDAYPNCKISIGRELTKLFEEIVTMSGVEALSWVQNHPILKGEAVVMVELGDDGESGPDVGEQSNEDLVIEAAKKGFAQGRTLKDLLKDLSGSGLARSDLYQLLLKVKSGN
ncbi:MAG: 16S rRNA (cytidine(1402)-2'-O)-methyltransferase [Proteobacteria bacterium]|nr:16S rRNA (cytidine(1402)-2'-O)-methyltransferase [Pseudomonadota bacterium]